MDEKLEACPLCKRTPWRNGRGSVGGVVCASPAHLFQTYGVSQKEADKAWNSAAATPDRSDDALAEGQQMPTIWEDPAGKGYPCFERPMTPNEARETIERHGREIAEQENELDRLRKQLENCYRSFSHIETLIAERRFTPARNFAAQAREAARAALKGEEL